MPICNSICALCKHYDSDACLYCLITDDAEGGMEFSNYEYIGGVQTMPEIKDSGKSMDEKEIAKEPKLLCGMIDLYVNYPNNGTVVINANNDSIRITIRKEEQDEKD